MTDARQLPLLGLLSDAILPGEERTLAADALDPKTFAAVLKAKPKRLLALAIRSSVELPSFVTGRVGTACDVVRVDKAALTLRGVGRVSVVRATDGAPPVALVDDAPADGGLAEIGPALARLLVELSSEPRSADVDLGAAARAVLRAGPQGALREAMSAPIEQALATAAGGATSSAAATVITRDLDALRPAAGARLSDDDKRVVSARIAQLQKDLDLLPPLEGGDPLHGDLTAIERRLDAAGLPEEARNLARRELAAVRGMNKQHYDYPTTIAHLELMASLPWSGALSAPPPFAAFEASLEREHFGLERAKKRILEYIAVRALGGAGRGLVLCLLGPPGVGKTSLARSIADGLGRKLVRVALGGVHDESEIRGHRRTFTNAGPGRILSGMRSAPRDPVVLLDEIDKIGTDRGRSPSAALLEVLDPEQNHAFTDNFLGCGFDLSSALFIATANDASDIQPALKDRLEVIDLEGYTVEEKIVIAERHLLARVRADTGLPSAPPLDRASIEHLVARYTREAGVRELQRVLGSLLRARAVRVARGEAGASDAAITPDEIAEILGPPRFRPMDVSMDHPPGRVHGLSVGPEGGAILTVEVLAIPGDGALRLTGRQGEVMREACEAARTFVRANASRLSLRAEVTKVDLHVHLPEAAVRKEGPSAGLATALAIASALAERRLRGDVAMTGELNLSGAVLPVGGVRAKVLAAERAGLRRVLLPRANAADAPKEAKIEIVFVDRFDDAWAELVLPD